MAPNARHRSIVDGNGIELIASKSSTDGGSAELMPRACRLDDLHFRAQTSYGEAMYRATSSVTKMPSRLAQAPRPSRGMPGADGGRHLRPVSTSARVVTARERGSLDVACPAPNAAPIRSALGAGASAAACRNRYRAPHQYLQLLLFLSRRR